jgi:CheY-like chemotaxis protein/DNA-directed RNA polymerase specialized sigma24 family protein
MSVSDKLALQLPYLRRFARALTGSQVAGDAYVRIMLEAALADKDLLQRIAGSRVALYTAFHRIWEGVQADPAGGSGGSGIHEQSAQARLAQVTPRHRAALLLTSLEEFSPEETGEIMAISPNEVITLVTQAVSEIERETAADVLIIEDEPLISMQLEDLATGLGHNVVATATTRTQARERFAETRPNLVLADIQLADGSSGIDAVEDILKFGDVPVIFITAFPEKLLTGQRPEPTYIITKPFQEATVRAAISQALFFGSTRPMVSENS